MSINDLEFKLDRERFSYLRLGILSLVFVISLFFLFSSVASAATTDNQNTVDSDYIPIDDNFGSMLGSGRDYDFSSLELKTYASNSIDVLPRFSRCDSDSVAACTTDTYYIFGTSSAVWQGFVDGVEVLPVGNYFTIPSGSHTVYFSASGSAKFTFESSKFYWFTFVQSDSDDYFLLGSLNGNVNYNGGSAPLWYTYWISEASPANSSFPWFKLNQDMSAPTVPPDTTDFNWLIPGSNLWSLDKRDFNKFVFELDPDLSYSTSAIINLYHATGTVTSTSTNAYSNMGGGYLSWLPHASQYPIFDPDHQNNVYYLNKSTWWTGTTSTHTVMAVIYDGNWWDPTATNTRKFTETPYTFVIDGPPNNWSYATSTDYPYGYLVPDTDDFPSLDSYGNPPYGWGTESSTSTTSIDSCDDVDYGVIWGDSYVVQGACALKAVLNWFLKLAVLPHNFSKSYVRSNVEQFKFLFPFNIFFNFEAVVRQRLPQTYASSSSVSLPLFISSSSIEIFDDQTLERVIGANNKSTWFSIAENLIWAGLGFLIVLTVL